MQAVSKSGLYLAQAVRPHCKCVRLGHDSRGTVEGAKCASLSLNVPGTVPAVTPSYLFFLSAFSPVWVNVSVVQLVYVRGNWSGICLVKSVLLEMPLELIFWFGYRMDKKVGSISDSFTGFS